MHFILFFIVLFAFSASAQPFDNSRYAEIDGISIHYRYWEIPANEAEGHVLLIHGFGGSSFSWEEVADSLHHLNYEVVAADMPPFGYSDKYHTINQSRTAHARRVHSLLEQEYPGRKWHLAGHSMGGTIAQAYALMYPDELRSVTFVAPVLFSSVEPDDSDNSSLLRFSFLPFIAGELAEEWFIRHSRVESLLESAYGKTPTEEQVEAYLRPLLLPGTARAILSAPAYNREKDSLDAADLQVPAIAIWGENDTWVSHHSQKENLERMPGVKLTLLPDVGHNPMETHFEDFMETWLPFLKDF